MFVFPSSKGRAKDICVPTLAKRGIKSVWYTNGFPGWWTKPFFCIEEPIDEVKNSLRKLKKSGFTNIFSNVLRAKLVSSSSEEYWGYSDLHLVLLGSYLWCFARAFVSFYLFFHTFLPYYYETTTWSEFKKTKLLPILLFLSLNYPFFSSLVAYFQCFYNQLLASNSCFVPLVFAPVSLGSLLFSVKAL